VSAGALELRYPDGWRRVASPPRIPGLDFKQRELALTREGSPRSDALVAGMTAATGPALLSQELLDRLGKPPARDDAVQLGDLDAYRYRDLRVRGFNGRPTLYVVPTTRGVATVACTARPAEEEAFLPSCEQVAGGLELVAGRAFPLGPDKRYLATLTRTIKRLNTSRKPHLRQLRGAERPAGQARAARAIAADYRRAERRLGRLQVSPAVKDASAAVRAALRRTEAAYRRLAAAAAAGDDAAFDDARRDVAAGDRALRRALRRVKAASR
jgi:hypothetical protein